MKYFIMNNFEAQKDDWRSLFLFFLHNPIILIYCLLYLITVLVVILIILKLRAIAFPPEPMEDTAIMRDLYEVFRVFPCKPWTASDPDFMMPSIPYEYRVLMEFYPYDMIVEMARKAKEAKEAIDAIDADESMLKKRVYIGLGILIFIYYYFFS